MKPRAAAKYFGPLLFAGMLTGGFESHALPPLQHPARGAIESVDHAERTLVLVDSKTRTSRIFLWNDSTRLRKNGVKVSADFLRTGIEVKGYYRKEVGQFVLRELRWSDPAPRKTKTKTPRNPESRRPLDRSSGQKP